MTTVLLGCLLVAPWAVVCIMAKFAALETTIGWTGALLLLLACVFTAHLDESANYHQTFGWSESCSSASSKFDCFSDLVV
jgi:L-amino acid N-acyltransferase YncA